MKLKEIKSLHNYVIFKFLVLVLPMTKYIENHHQKERQQ